MIRFETFRNGKVIKTRKFRFFLFALIYMMLNPKTFSKRDIDCLLWYQKTGANNVDYVINLG